MKFRYFLLGFYVFAGSMQNSMASEHCYSPCYPNNVDRCNAYVKFLYWQPFMDDLKVAWTNHVEISESEDPDIVKHVDANSRLLDPGKNGDWSPGVSFGIEWRPNCSDWMFAWECTYFHSKTVEKLSSPFLFTDTDLFLVAPAWNAANMGGWIESCQSEWNVDFFMMDFLLVKSLYKLSNWIFKPNFGVRGAWIQQKLKADYLNPLFLTGGVPDIISRSRTSSEMDAHWWGVGFKGGIDVDVPLFHCLNLIGSFGGSLLYGKVCTDMQMLGYHVEPDPGNPEERVLGSLNAQNTIHQYGVKVNVESEIGLSYRPNWYQCFCDVEFSASYFLAVWFNQNHVHDVLYTAPVINIDNIPSQAVISHRNGNLQLSGLILRAKMYF